MAHRCRTFLPLSLAILVLTPALKLSLAQTRESAASVPASKSSSSAAVRLSSTYGKLPLSFEINEGQTDGSVQFLARQAGYTLFLTPGEAVLSLHSAPPRATKPEMPAAGKQPTTPLTDVVRMELIGANSRAQAAGVDPLPGKSNYFIGNDPAKWHTDVPTFAKVRYQSIYPGIDLLYYGNQEGRLEHDFVVSPGADPNAIVLSMRGSEGAVSEHSGELTLRTKTGDLTLRSPVVYQEVSGQRKTIPATYELAKNNQIKFQIGSYDKSEPLVIDPVIEYSAVFGGSQEDIVSSIALDSAGDAYVAGATYSTDFPLADPYQSSWTSVSPSSSTAAVVSKLNPSGMAFLYSTYLGGPSSGADNIKVDSAGRAYITGGTGSGFPLMNAFQPTYGGNIDAFVTVLSPNGDSLVYSTYLGGSQFDVPTALAIDGSDNAYITGFTNGSFPTTHSIDYKNGYGLFIAKFNSSGVLEYSTTYSNDAGESTAIAADSTGAVYITGYDNLPTGIPVTKGAFQTKCTYTFGCAFVTKFSPSGASLVYSTWLDFDSGGVGTSIAVDSSAEAYVAGAATNGLLTRSSSFQKTYGGGGDGFVLKLNSSGSDLLWSTYLGGKGDDVVYGLALDSHRNVYVAGFTCSSNFPLKAAVQKYVGTKSHPCQFFVTTLNGSLSALPYYSTYFGTATGSNQGIGIAVDPQLNVYIAGYDDANVQATPGALNIGLAGNPGGGLDVFLSKLVIEDDLALGVSASPSPVAQGGTLTYTIAITSKGPDFGYNVRMSDPIPAGTTFVSYDAGGGKCTAPAVGGTGLFHCEILQLNKGDTWNVKLTVLVNAASGSTLSNTATTVSNTQDFTPSNNTGTITTPVD